MQKILKWRPELVLGVDMMDRHHRGMVELCGAILEKTGSREGTASAVNLFFDLVKLTAMHFEAEEELMRRSDYPGRMDHQDRHHELSLLLQSWEARARHRNLPLNPSFLNHLSQWVENHILGSDKGFSRFLLGRHGEDPTDPSNGKLIGQPAVALKTVSCHRFTQTQPARRHFYRSVARIKHF